MTPFDLLAFRFLLASGGCLAAALAVWALTALCRRLPGFSMQRSMWLLSQITVVATFLPGYQGWCVRFYPAWDDYPGADMAESARRMNAFIEERVREAPAEYFWTHKRFKTRPEGEPSFYA